jgi:hypothetical protein
LIEALHDLIDGFGGVLRLRYTTYAVFARMAGESTWSC